MTDVPDLGCCFLRGNWTAVSDAIGELPWRSTWGADNPVERLNVHLSLLVERFVLTQVIRVHNKDKPWFNGECRRAFNLKKHAHLPWTRYRSRVNSTQLNCGELVHY